MIANAQFPAHPALGFLILAVVLFAFVFVIFSKALERKYPSLAARSAGGGDGGSKPTIGSDAGVSHDHGDHGGTPSPRREGDRVSPPAPEPLSRGDHTP